MYGEEVHFSQVAGKPALVAYVQRSWNPNVPTHPPMHIETGYLRPQPHHRVELLVCDPTGVAQGTAAPHHHRHPSWRRSNPLRASPACVV